MVPDVPPVVDPPPLTVPDSPPVPVVELLCARVLTEVAARSNPAAIRETDLDGMMYNLVVLNYER